MGTHRRRAGRARGRRAGLLAGAMLLAGATALLLAVVRADLAPSGLAAGPTTPPTAPSAVASTASAGPFEGTWTGRLADPDTTPVDVRLTVGGPTDGLVVEVPAQGCTYRGAAPPPGAVVDVRVDPRVDGTRAAGCAATARVRLADAGAGGPATDRLRYEVLSTCDGTACAPRRADGVLTAWRPGP